MADDTDDAPSSYIVFMKDGTHVTEVDASGLHNLACRDDYGFALDASNIPEVVESLCEEYGLPPQVYGWVVQDALTRGAITSGTAAIMTLETQKACDAGIITRH